MRLLILLFLFFTFIYCVFCKNNVQSLTESMGQEIIEIGTPIRELPSGLEEEPSAENDEDEKRSSNTAQPATKNELKKTTMITEPRRISTKEIDRIDGVTQEDDEARIEKELAELYKDTAEYKSDSAESSKEGIARSNNSLQVDKPIGRSRENFKFQPDVTNKAEVERFRTSVDEISCDKRVTALAADSSLEVERENSASQFTISLIRLCITTFIVLNY